MSEVRFVYKKCFTVVITEELHHLVAFQISCQQRTSARNVIKILLKKWWHVVGGHVP